MRPSSGHFRPSASGGYFRLSECHLKPHGGSGRLLETTGGHLKLPEDHFGTQGGHLKALGGYLGPPGGNLRPQGGHLRPA